MGFAHASDGYTTLLGAPGGRPGAIVTAGTGSIGEALLEWGERAGQNAYAALAPFVFDTAATDTKAAQLLDDAARAIDGIALALDPDGRSPLVVSGSIGQRLQSRLAPTRRARIWPAAR